MSDLPREYIFGTYTRSSNGGSDLLTVKEHIHNPDGTTTSNLRLIKDYQRDFYITRTEFRDYEQKKEYAPIDRLEHFRSSQIDMPGKIARALKIFGANSMYQLSESPHIYGTDISTTSLVANDYQTKWPELNSDATLAIMDFETDVLNGTKDIVMGAVTFQDKGILSVTRDFMREPNEKALSDKEIEARIQAGIDQYLPDQGKARIKDIEIVVAEECWDVVVGLMTRVHEWAPDFLGFWNMSFDIGKINDALKKGQSHYGRILDGLKEGLAIKPADEVLLAQIRDVKRRYYELEPKNVFSDPSIPDEYRHYNFYEDLKIKRIAGGKTMVKHHADLWHTVTAPASFYCICLMATFKRLRAHEALRNSYSLDAILGEILELSKLKFSGADGLTRLQWHRKMQTEYKVEYCVYNIWDCISVELLDEATLDVRTSTRLSVGISDLKNLNSTPKRLCDALHFELLKTNRVIGCTSPDMTENPFDKHTPSVDGWIITLAAELQYATGKALINELPGHETNIITHAGDIDVEGAYPTLEAILGTSKGTTRIEVCDIKGMSETERRGIGLSVTALPVNACEVSRKVLGMPTHGELLARFNARTM